MNTELDLLHHVLDPRVGYPWNPQDPDSQALLTEAEADWDEAETAQAIAAGWQTFSTQLDYVWATAGASGGLLETLTRRFAARMPADVLQQIAQQAAVVAASGQPMMEQLIQCTREILSGWDIEDLQVLARPLAHSLRDGEGEVLDLHLRSVRQTEWSSLSEIERARLSLAIASFAIATAKSQTPPQAE
ncbi:hypothetical protein C7271_13310 [filamentous cyanobacterium CCP5]|nr:hypothetical protein C7271_13310 [filamentous cyanobacterium CCP5]